jgi:hypothetical protein
MSHLKAFQVLNPSGGVGKRPEFSTLGVNVLFAELGEPLSLFSWATEPEEALMTDGVGCISLGGGVVHVVAGPRHFSVSKKRARIHP